MNKPTSFKFSTGVIAYPLVLVLSIWVVFWIEIRSGLRFTTLGIYPLTLSGLKGIILSPFIHSNLSHLYQNSIPLFVLSLSLFYFYKPIAWKIIILGIIVSGTLTWCIARPAYHIGASGLVYILFSFVFFKGIIAKHYRLIAVSLSVIFIYGSMVWYAFPIDETISWEGHLSGLITGLLFAIWFRKSVAQSKKYEWEMPNYNEAEDPFLNHFDENGNFIEHIEEEINDSTSETNEDLNQTKIYYTFKENKSDT